VELIRIRLPAKNRAALVAQRHLRDISTFVVFVFFFAYERSRNGIGRVLNSISLDPVGGDFNELGWSLDRAAVLDLDFGRLRLHSPNGTDESILFFSAVEDGNSRTHRTDAVLRVNRRYESQD